MRSPRLMPSAANAAAQAALKRASRPYVIVAPLNSSAGLSGWLCAASAR